MSEKIELKVGKWVEGTGFVGDVVQFQGEQLAEESASTDHMDLNMVLYKCGTGYCVYFRMAFDAVDGEPRRGRAGLFPNDDEGNYLLYTEEEARGHFSGLFARAGLHPVKTVSFSKPAPKPAENRTESERTIRVVRRNKNLRRREGVAARPR